MNFYLSTIFISVLFSKVYQSNGQHIPRIITAPKDQTAVDGSVASFVCTAIGNPKPNIEWRKNGRKITNQRYLELAISYGSVLRIQHLRQSRDNATFECVVEYGVRQTVSASADLTILSQQDIPEGFPQFPANQSMSLTIKSGGFARIACKAEGDPLPHISWLKEMVPIDMSNTRYSFDKFGSLQISATEHRDHGTYECVAQNKFGTAYSESVRLYIA